MLASGGVCIGDVPEVEFLFWKGDNGFYRASKGTWWRKIWDESWF